MIYSSNSASAISAMERDRTGNYGDCEALDEECPACLALNPNYYYIDENDKCVGCSECVTRVMSYEGL